MKPTVAYNVISKLSTEEQQELLERFGAEGLSKKSSRVIEEQVEQLKKEKNDLKNENAHLNKTVESLMNKPPRIKEVIKEVVPERIKNELEDLRSKYDKTKSNEEALQKLIGEIDSEKSRLEEYISSSEFELLETKRKEEIVQSKTHVSMFDLQLKIQKFINEAAPPLYLQGAMAYADSYVRRELIESTKSLEKFVDNLKEYLFESIPKHQNYNNIIEIKQIEESINE